MLFLLNDHILEVDAPEARLARRWKTLGCGDPRAMMARDALEFARSVVESYQVNETPMEKETKDDLAALIIAKTGANAVLFLQAGEPRLTLLPEGILSQLKERAVDDQPVEVSEIWPKAA